ncbi:uncharacterized protein EAE98_006010 [Botrytis deweyae]|uniref:Uncharacterized protein n=1 Tax=Botrytis deweyae TaxID=2478750 RepID=A0ABQ7ILD6_9HELO|nr:uncharacterized protein EAE98_006010 [Botrytis deweyae]KAF7927628.1 hypothetical protein EAE98_006010 [Botrytis deweyae]
MNRNITQTITDSQHNTFSPSSQLSNFFIFSTPHHTQHPTKTIKHDLQTLHPHHPPLILVLQPPQTKKSTSPPPTTASLRRKPSSTNSLWVSTSSNANTMRFSPGICSLSKQSILRKWVWVPRFSIPSPNPAPQTSDSAPTAQNSPMIGEGIFTQDSHSWKYSHSILHRQFSRVQSQSQSQNLSIFSAPLEKILAVLSSRSGTIDLQPLFFLFRFTLETNHYFSSLRRELLSSFPLPFLPLPFPPLPIQTRSLREKFLLHLPHLISALHLRLRLSNLY